MRGVWRLSTVSRAAGAFIVGLALLYPFGNALAQSSTGAAASAATGRSLTDAVNQNERELIDREVLGAGRPGGDATAGGGGGGGGGAGSAGAAAAGSAFPTGRVRSSDHDGLRPSDPMHFSYSTGEVSAF